MGTFSLGYAIPALSLVLNIPFPQVENDMFKIDRHYLTRHSTHFKTLINPSSGSSESNPFVVDDATSEQFANFLWVFYKCATILSCICRVTSSSMSSEFSYKADFEKWKQILTLARQWGIARVERLCIRELQDLEIDPVDKIELYQEFKLSANYLRKSFAALVMRPLPLSVEEGERLGLPTTIRLFEARERARDPNLSITLQELEVQPIIEDVFGLQGSTPPVMNRFI